MSKFPPDANRKLITKTKFENKSFTLLSHDLCQAESKSGFTIVRNGSQYFSAKNATIIRQRFTCQNYQKYRSSVLDRNNEYRDFQKFTYHYNRANQRPMYCLSEKIKSLGADLAIPELCSNCPMNICMISCQSL